MGNNIFVLILFCAISFIVAYFLGSINFAIIISKKLFKEDVRHKGSGNAGMTNVLRNYGAKGAAFTLIGDILKGVVSVLIGRFIFVVFLPEAFVEYGMYIAAVGAVIGHMFPIFFGFKGGKSIAVSGGVIIATQPIVALALVMVFLLVALISGMVSLGSVIGMGMYPVAIFLFLVFKGGDKPVLFCIICAAVISFMVIFMHRGNIKRIINGTEHRFGKRFKKAVEDKDLQEVK